MTMLSSGNAQATNNQSLTHADIATMIPPLLTIIHGKIDPSAFLYRKLNSTIHDLSFQDLIDLSEYLKAPWPEALCNPSDTSI